MRASEFGCLPPSLVGLWSFNEADRDTWGHEAFDTKEEAIKAGRAHFGPPIGFDVGRFVEADVDAPDANDVFEQASERLCDEVPSDLVSDYLGQVTDADKDRLSAALEKAFGDWLTETNNWPDFCKVADIERIAPEGG